MAENNLTSIQLAAVVILVVTTIVLTGMVITANYSRILREETAVEKTSTFTLGQAGIENSTMIGTLGQYPFLQTVTNCTNITDAGTVTLPEANYTVLEGNENGGYIYPTAGTRLINNSINCSITYDADSTGQATADKFIAGLAIFGTFMAVIVLAIVGKIIIGLFRKKSE